jgi:hypothetical protein
MWDKIEMNYFWKGEELQKKVEMRYAEGFGVLISQVVRTDANLHRRIAERFDRQRWVQ